MGGWDVGNWSRGSPGNTGLIKEESWTHSVGECIMGQDSSAAGFSIKFSQPAPTTSSLPRKLNDLRQRNLQVHYS